MNVRLSHDGRYKNRTENPNDMILSHSTWLEKNISYSFDNRTSEKLFSAYMALKRLHGDLTNRSALFTLLTLRMPNLLLGGFNWVSEKSDGGNHQHIISDNESLSDSDTASSEYSDYSSHCYMSHIKEMDGGKSGCAPDFSMKEMTVCDTWLDRHSQMLLDIIDYTDYTQDEDIQRLRLDYVVTQIDISRMARNASRHLDVASILSLPTVTFRGLIPPPRNHITGMQESSLEDSWMMVSSIPLDENTDRTGESTTDIEYGTSKKSEHDLCVICLEKFVHGDTLRVLPCGHSFHTSCVDHWLLGTYSDADCITTGCPTCKKHATSIDDISSDDQYMTLDGSVPSWAFARLGDALAKESFANDAVSEVLSCASSLSQEQNGDNSSRQDRKSVV